MPFATLGSFSLDFNLPINTTDHLARPRTDLRLGAETVLDWNSTLQHSHPTPSLTVSNAGAYNFLCSSFAAEEFRLAYSSRATRGRPMSLQDSRI